jgi:hypothetical protein
MITDKDIDTKAKESGISAIAVEKDYVYGWLLKELFNRPALSQLLVLKGGQAIRKGYLPSTRFSKDLDFSALAHIDTWLLEGELRGVCAAINAATGITFLDRIVTRDKNLPIPRGCRTLRPNSRYQVLPDLARCIAVDMCVQL